MATFHELLAEAQALRASGRSREAEQRIRQLLVGHGDEPLAHLALAQALAEQDRLEEAVASFQQAAQLDPASIDIDTQLRRAAAALETRRGVALVDARRFDEALACYRRALEADPNCVAAYGNLGNLLGVQRRLDEAATCFRRVIELDPNMPHAHHALAMIADQQGQLETAAAHYQRLLKLAPPTAELQHRLGQRLAQLDRPAEAAERFRRALALNPHALTSQHNLGVMLARSGQFDEALAVQRQTAARSPDDPESHIALGGTLLILGRLAEGWPEYEWRTQLQITAPPPLQWKLWQGEPLAGRTIVLCAEQAIGDVLQFVRFAPLLQAGGARVIVRCAALLQPILSRTPGIDGWLTDPAAWYAADFCVPMMSVPLRLGTTLANIPAEVPYILPDPVLVEAWRQKLATHSGFKIGIVWQGSKIGDLGRSMSLAHFAPLAAVPGVCLVNLQKGHGVEQLPAFAATHPIVDFGETVDSTAGAFMDTAAIMRNLDLVITADTATAHLAGALGVNVWVALRRVPEWRWLLDRDDSPWYPTMRLFRQTQLGQWDAVFQNMRAALQRVVSANAASASTASPKTAGQVPR